MACTAERQKAAVSHGGDVLVIKMSLFSLSVLLSLQAPPEHHNLLQPVTLTFTNDSSPC